MTVSFKDMKEMLDTVFENCASEITERSTYLDIEDWDSMAHISLMVALQEKYKIEIPDAIITELTSVAKILNFLGSIEKKYE